MWFTVLSKLPRTRGSMLAAFSKELPDLTSPAKEKQSTWYWPWDYWAVQILQLRCARALLSIAKRKGSRGLDREDGMILVIPAPKSSITPLTLRATVTDVISGDISRGLTRSFGVASVSILTTYSLHAPGAARDQFGRPTTLRHARM